MLRRDFIKTLAAAGLCAGQPWVGRSAQAAPLTSYDGKFFVSISADGGWDVTSLCDPKANSTINHWANGQGVQSINNSPIQYAPFAHNPSFFQKHHEKMLVINGIDCQTNAHEAGVRHIWSGRLAHGYPTFSAMAAAILGPNLPLAYISNGGYKETAGITQYTLMQDPTSLKKLVFPNQFLDYDPDGSWDPAKQYHRSGAMDIIQQAKMARLARLQAQSQLTPKQVNSLADVFNARVGVDQLAPLAQTLPDELVSNIDKDGEWNPLMRQGQIALAAYEAGLCVASDLTMWGFDTHSNHDVEQTTAMQRLQNGIDYLWDEATRRGIDDKLVVLISSDFGRTPLYNDGAGKDHWPITSTIIMSQGETWTNKVVGATTSEHTALSIDPATLALKEDGVRLQPKHIQQAMRQLAGIEAHEISQLFPLEAEDIQFF